MADWVVQKTQKLIGSCLYVCWAENANLGSTLVKWVLPSALELRAQNSGVNCAIMD